MCIGIKVSLSKGHYGTVNIERDGRPGSICYSGWGNSDARVLCRQLGYVDGSYYRIRQRYYIMSHVYLSSLYCSGNEASIFVCNNRGWEYSPYYCSRTLYISAAYCYGPGKMPYSLVVYTIFIHLNCDFHNFQCL